MQSPNRTISWLTPLLPLLLASTTFGCEAEPDLDDSHVTTELVMTSGSDVVTDADREAAHELAALADAVFIGEVVAIDYQMSEPDESGVRLPFTVVTWEIEDGIKGVETGSRHAVRFLGGPLDGDKLLEVSEIPQFEIGDRDMLFVARNGEVGCPLVGGAEGRVQLLGARQVGDGVSRVASGPSWSAEIAASIRAAGLAGGAPAEQLERDEPFVFAIPRTATADELAQLHERHLARRAALGERQVGPDLDPQDALALEANGLNPVLPR